jgi:hypothetical protein
MGRHKILTYDEEIDKYIRQTITDLENIGIKRVSKADALRFIIQQNQEVKLRFRRKPKTKNDVMFL